MSESSTSGQRSGSLPWAAVALLAVLSLIGGVFLGRVAFFTSEDGPTPRVTSIDVEDEDLEVGGEVEYFEEKEVYILSIRTLPPADEGKVYAVWMQTADVTTCAGVMNPNSRDFAYASYSGRYDTLIVTLEDGPYCGEEPTGDPLITADLTELEDEDD